MRIVINIRYFNKDGERARDTLRVETDHPGAIEIDFYDDEGFYMCPQSSTGSASK